MGWEATNSLINKKGVQDIVYIKHDQIKIVQKTLILENVCILNTLDTKLSYFSFDFINALRGKMLK